MVGGAWGGFEVEEGEFSSTMLHIIFHQKDTTV